MREEKKEKKREKKIGRLNAVASSKKIARTERGVVACGCDAAAESRRLVITPTVSCVPGTKNGFETWAKKSPPESCPPSLLFPNSPPVTVYFTNVCP